MEGVERRNRNLFPGLGLLGAGEHARYHEQQCDDSDAERDHLRFPRSQNRVREHPISCLIEIFRCDVGHPVLCLIENIHCAPPSCFAGPAGGSVSISALVRLVATKTWFATRRMSALVTLST